MSLNRTVQQFGLVLAALLLVAGLESLSHAVGDRLCGCGEPTPCSCAADGICRPKRTTWGHYDTRWRSWPGEPADRKPTAATPTPVRSEELDSIKGDSYELPKPEQEDLRTPPKAKKDRQDDGEEEAPLELPGQDPGQLLPGPGELPGELPGEEEPLDLDPFSTLPAVPHMEDAPPALPASLRQAAASISRPRVANRIAAARAKQPVAGLNITPKMLAPQVRQVGWEQPASMPLVNPAAAIQANPAQEPLQQAIYIESSDR